MKNLFLVCCILNFSMTPLIAQNQTEGQVWVIINYIKASSKADYEKWMTDIFFAPMKTTQDPVLKKQFSTARWQKPVRQNDDKTWTFSIILDPAIPSADYDIEHYLSKTYGEAKSKTYIQQYEGFMASSGQIHFFESNRATEGPSVKEDEEAIKKVIVIEFDAFVQRDFKTWADTYVDAPTTTFMVTNANSSGSLFAMSDFQKISKGMKGMFDSGSKSTMSLANRDGWLIRIKGDMAFAIYNEEFLLSNGTKIKGKTQKVMEKVNGQWKIATTSAICDFNNAVVPTPNPEEEAIKKVCIAESQAFANLDFDAYASYHVQTADEQLVYNNPDGTYGAEIGWDKISKIVKGWIQSGKKEDVSKVSGDNFTVVIHGDMAFVAYDGRYQKVADGKTTRLRENRTLLYSDGHWKILAVLVFIDYPSGK